MGIKIALTKAKHKIFQDKRVALIKLDGVIIDSNVMPVATKIIEALREVKKQGIKSVVLRINSPGGTVGASQEIYSAIKEIQEDGVKVIASFGDVAASGGVYVGVAADKIVCNSGTVTGSIGVIIRTNVVKGLYKKIGIDKQVVKSVQYKDILSDLKYLSRDERKILEELVDSTHNEFINMVAKERNLSLEDVKKFADGRIFSGIQAKEYGLVDEIGSQRDAIKLAASLTGIKGEPHVVNMTPKKSFWHTISKLSIDQVLEQIGVNSVTSGIPLWLMPGI